MKNSRTVFHRLALSALLAFLLLSVTLNDAGAYYTTREQDITDRVTGQKVLLKGFGIGCWLLPEGYMWGIRELDRPRHFEKAIIDLIGEKDAAEFWRLYHDNFMTEGDIKAMKQMGVNSVRIALLASQLQPRQSQPDKAPYKYSEVGFKYLDDLVDWCSKYKVGVIWDMHGAPGAQNAENISDSDGQARLWTEKEKYWPLCIDLWYKIAERYKDRECIIGYDLLNEPLLRRYDGIDVALLRELYVLLTKKVRTVDNDGIIFVEGDDWAQDFSGLEPLDWDKHLVVAFHSYPPTATQQGLKRWDRLRKKYNIPLWHGETGEQGPPYERNKQSTEFLQAVNVGWNWWTHKKFDRPTQPWLCPRTDGFIKIIDYWKGKAPRPSRQQAKKWLFEQAKLTNSDNCLFLSKMVDSLAGFNVQRYLATRDSLAPKIVREPKDISLEIGDSSSLIVMANGHPLNFQWYRNDKAIAGATTSKLRIEKPTLEDDGTAYTVKVFNEKGTAISKKAILTVKPYSGPVIPFTSKTPDIDAVIDKIWENAKYHRIDNLVLGRKSSADDITGRFRLLWDEEHLYVLVEVTDDIKRHTGEPGHRNDGVEVYIDYDNSKSDYYGDNDFQFRYEWSAAKVTIPIGSGFDGIVEAQADTAGGYVMEMALPWQSLGGPAPADKHIGIDVHINDNDNDRRVREAKVAWHTKRDNTYKSPMYFGTIKLSGPE